MSTVLIALPGGQGVVRGHDGQVEITHDVTGDHGQPVRPDDRYHPVKTWMPDDRSLVGGLLPPGAVSAEVVDDRGQRIQAGTGGGAYVAILEQPNDGLDPIVCCRDTAGAPVRRPLPADYPSARVDDADVPCPACGALDFEQRSPTEPWRGGQPGPAGTIVPNPIVVCRCCGHQEPERSFFGLHATSESDEDEAARAQPIAQARAHARVHRWYASGMTLRALTFPIYAAEGWPAAIGSSGSSGDELTSLTIAHHDSPDADPYLGDHPRLQVTTASEHAPGDELWQARSVLHTWLLNNDDQRSSWPGASPAAMTLWLAARDRDTRARVLTASRSEQLIPIDGTPEPFLMLTAPPRLWVAARRHADLVITIEARDLDPGEITLEPVADPAARLLGPEPPGAERWPE